jgi:hypothetical protein
MRLMTRSITTAAVMYSVTISAASAQAARPNLTGTWVMDASKTVVDGNLGAASAATSKIAQHGDTIVVDRETTTESTGVVMSHTVWGVDGKPWKNTVPVNGTDAEVTSVLAWEGNVLVIRSSLTVMDNAVDLVDRWTMAADGKSITMVRAGSAMGQELGTTTTVFVKQP